MTFSVVQSTSFKGTSGSFASATTAGNTVVVAVVDGSSSGGVTISLNAVTLGGVADNFASAVSIGGASGAQLAAFWVDSNCAGGKTALAISETNGVDPIVFAWEVTGATTTVDVTQSSSGTSNSPSSGTTSATTSSTEIALGVLASKFAAGTLTGASGYTNLAAVTGTGNKNKGVAGYLVLSSTGTQVYTGSTGGSGGWAGAIITLKSATTITGTGSLALGAPALHGSGAETISGTGSVKLGALAFHGAGVETYGRVALGPLAFHGTGTLKISGTGSLRLGPLAMSGINYTTGTGSLALAPIALHGAGTEKITGTGSLRLGALTIGGSVREAATPPTIPVEPAGVIATAADHNAWAAASTWFLSSTPEMKPVFFLTAAGAQALTTSATAVQWSNAGAVFKDNNSGWLAANPTRYTVWTAGYYHIEWSVTASAGAGNLQCYAQVTTGAGNPYNPSGSFRFQYANRAAASALVAASAGGLVPVYLVPGDYIEVYATVGSAVNTASPYPQLSGEWVSS